MSTQTFVISLADTVQFLRSAYREYALKAVLAHQGNGPLPFSNLEYDGIDFMRALVDEIGCSDECPVDLGQPPLSMGHLVRAGFDVKMASYLAHEAYKSVLDAIATFLPDATFNPYDDWQYAFANGCDMVVTRPRPADQIQVPREPTIMDEIEESRFTRVPTAVPGRPITRFNWDTATLPPDYLMTRSSSDLDALRHPSKGD